MYLDAYKDHPWRLQTVQQYTHEDQNPDRIKLRVLQKIVRPITKAQIKIKSKVFRNPSQSSTGFKNFERGSANCLKIIEDKALDASLIKREDHSQLRRESQVRHKKWDLNPNVDFIIKETWGSRPKARRDTRAAHQMRPWVALRFASNASMWAPRSHSDATLWSLWAPCLTTEGGLRPMWDPLSVVADPRYWVN